jgi:HSP20 family protein
MYTTYDVFDDILNLRNVFDRFFQEIPIQKRVDFPYINLYEKDDAITVKVIVPGVNSEDFDIQLTDTSLVIEGERKSDYADKPYIRKERYFTRFKKSVKLPYDVDRDKISASLNDGILTITLVKSEAAKPKKIEIK